MHENVLKFDQLQLPFERGPARNGRNPQDLDGVVSLESYLPQGATPSVSAGLSHNVYCKKCVRLPQYADLIEGKKPNGGADLDLFISRRLNLLDYLTNNTNPNIKNRGRRIRQVVMELRTHWQLISEVRHD